MSLDDVIASRRGVRDAYRDAVLDEARSRLIDADGSLDGAPVLTEPKLLEVVAAVFDREVPIPSEKHAEVRTPAVVTVAAICPKCDLPTTVLATITAQLVVDDDGSEVQVKTKSKARSHVCYQSELPLGEPTETDGLEQLPIPFGEPPISPEELRDLLSLVKGVFDEDAIPELEEINDWTEPIREQVKRWASDVYNLEGGVEAYLALGDDAEPLLPRVLGGETDPPEPAEEIAEGAPTGTGEDPGEDEDDGEETPA